jgi:nucleotidyltransferase/DNA polymerase involved in DNA repair
MGARSKVDLLPAAVKSELDKRLVEGNFSGYKAIADYFKAQGFDLSKSAIHRHGEKMERSLKAIKLTTEQARAIVDASPDDEDALNQALVRLTQEKLFQVLLDIDIDPDKINISGLTKSIAELSRASVTMKDFAAKVKSRAKEAATQVESIVKKAGLTKEAAQEITQKILGIAV